MRVITIVHTETVEDIIRKGMTVMRTVPVERTTTNNTETIETRLRIKKIQTKVPEMNFEKYWDVKDVSDGLKREELFQGALRVNIRNYKESYIASPVPGERDVCIDGILDRNRAMNGDVVVVQLNPKEKWRKEKV